MASTAARRKGPAHLRAALEEAARGGNDTDTVAAITGGLLGAGYGISAVPFEWCRPLHGWPGSTQWTWSGSGWNSLREKAPESDLGPTSTGSTTRATSRRPKWKW
ncbi:ADP-ribosylglycohydrolase family protein [Sinomonas humi]|uniref:ADP-ribosylglycohydrolase family protein n=1 Tax=Sinomonas humi TaxID=1338436 RepID=UPI0018CF5D97